MRHNTIEWTRSKLNLFKQTYNAEKDAGKDAVFTFEGHSFVVGYAKYLIEYLEGRLQ